jgi:threonine dehydrogenase-like Zn-dependent dehydrogenase
MSAPLLVGPSTFSFAPSPAWDASSLQPGEALVRVRAGGICGSDLPFFRGAPVPAYAGGTEVPVGYPMHEIVGELVGVGPDTDAPPVGSIVVGWATRFDGLADLVVTDAGSLAQCPDGWDPGEAVLMQPLACVLYAVERLGPVDGLHCAVLGLGPIGLLFCHVLKERGAAVVTGIDRIDRRDVAAEFGIDRVGWTTGADWASAVSAGAAEAPHAVVEAVGHQVGTLQDALTAVAFGGRVFYFGVNDDRVYPLDMDAMLRKNLTLISGGTIDRTRMLGEAADYLTRYPQLVKSSVTHRFDRAEVQRAYDAAATPSRGRLKVVIDFDADRG